MSKKIINRVANSDIISIDLEKKYPAGERVIFDIKNNLYKERVLQEKEFRSFISKYDWSVYKGKNVAILCSIDAIIPIWAYMLIASKLTSIATHFIFGSLEDLEKSLFTTVLNKLKIEEYKDKKIVIKGCSNYNIPTAAYVELIKILQPLAASLMFGEPCSTVPIFKRSRK